MSDPLELPSRDEADAKAWFYLEHRHDIETWAALRSDAARLVERYLLALLPTVDELSGELGADLYQADLEAGAWPRFGLRREAWQAEGLHDVGVVAEWTRGRLLSGTRPWPYVGVRITPRQRDATRREQLSSAVTPARPAFTGGRTAIWPVWQYVVPPGGPEAAVDPEALAIRVWERMRELWELAAPGLDAVHVAPRPLGGAAEADY